MGQDEAGILAGLRTHQRELIDPKIAEHKGWIESTDAGFQPHHISKAVLPKPRQTPKTFYAVDPDMCQRIPASTRRFQPMRRTAISLGVLHLNGRRNRRNG
jgi:hypothetical protein